MKATISTNEVADFLRRRVRRGTLIPGQRITENEVMGDTGATRARVRQALQMLASEGLVSIEEFRGASIRRLSVREVMQLYEVRAVNEGLAARLLAEHGSSENHAELAALQAQMNGCEDESDGEGYGTLNDSWHRLIVERCDNAHLRELVVRLRIPIVPLEFDSFRSRAAMERSNAAHRLVTEAILSRNGARAEAAMRAHIDTGRADIAALGDRY